MARFRYVDGAGRPVRDAATLARIRALVIPPAWQQVWICSSERGHIQATGRDARGRKQYRYHAGWREHRDAHKYARMVDFGSAIRRLRAATESDLALPGLPRDKVLATLVKLLDLTHARVGNEEYAKANRSYGLSTLKNRHVDVEGSTITFRFRGKSGKEHVLGVKDPKLARIVLKCEELPGQHLFEYVGDGGTVHAIGSHDVNDYIRAASGDAFSAKDLRTLAGTVLAARALRAQPPCTSKAQLKRAERAALEYVAGRLGNTVAVCRKCYVHPAVLEGYERSVLGNDDEDEREEEEAVLRIVSRCTLLSEHSSR
ncbi:MAG TPA: DNA topoisomerase IB [Polyangiaceae bacterium]|nr:DNA topoisomerase IB [Polyangiaceae bacterium]